MVIYGIMSSANVIVLLLFLPFGCLLLLLLSDCYGWDFQYEAEQKW